MRQEVIIFLGYQKFRYLPKTAGWLIDKGGFVTDDIWVLHTRQIPNFSQSIVLFSLTCRLVEFDNFQGIFAPIVLVDYLID
mgnify:CR=1 FL=1